MTQSATLTWPIYLFRQVGHSLHPRTNSVRTRCQCPNILTQFVLVGDWFETYASAMELNVWTGSRIIAAAYNHNTATWTVEVQRSDLDKRILHPHHVYVFLVALINMTCDLILYPES